MRGFSELAGQVTRATVRSAVARAAPVTAASLSAGVAPDRPDCLSLLYTLREEHPSTGYLALDLTSCTLPVLRVASSVGEFDPGRSAAISLRTFTLQAGRSWEGTSLQVDLAWSRTDLSLVVLPQEAPWIGSRTAGAWPAVWGAGRNDDIAQVVGVPLPRHGYASAAVIRADRLEPPGLCAESVVVETSLLSRSLSPYELHNLKLDFSLLIERLVELTGAPFRCTVVLCDEREVSPAVLRAPSGPVIPVNTLSKSMRGTDEPRWSASQLLRASRLIWGSACRLAGDGGPLLQSAFTTVAALATAEDLGRHEMLSRFVSQLRRESRTPHLSAISTRWTGRVPRRHAARLTLWLLEELKAPAVLRAFQELTARSWSKETTAHCAAEGLLQAGARPHALLPVG